MPGAVTAEDVARFRRDGVLARTVAAFRERRPLVAGGEARKRVTVATLAGVFSASTVSPQAPVTIDEQGILGPGSYVLEIRSEARVPRPGAPISRGDNVVVDSRGSLQLTLGPAP